MEFVELQHPPPRGAPRFLSYPVVYGTQITRNSTGLLHGQGEQALHIDLWFDPELGYCQGG